MRIHGSSRDEVTSGRERLRRKILLSVLAVFGIRDKMRLAGAGPRVPVQPVIGHRPGCLQLIRFVARS